MTRDEMIGQAAILYVAYITHTEQNCRMYSFSDFIDQVEKASIRLFENKKRYLEQLEKEKP